MGLMMVVGLVGVGVEGLRDVCKREHGAGRLQHERQG